MLACRQTGSSFISELTSRQRPGRRKRPASGGPRLALRVNEDGTGPGVHDRDVRPFSGRDSVRHVSLLDV